MTDDVKARIVRIIANGVTEYRPEGKPIEEIAGAIDQAYKDAGYMTGEEWYERFEKELDEEVYAIFEHWLMRKLWNQPLYEKHHILEAAKRATGFEGAR